MADTFPRVNGGMIQSGRYNNGLVSLVGKMLAHDKLQAADGTIVHMTTEAMAEPPMVNPDMVVEVMGTPTDETTFTVRRQDVSMCSFCSLCSCLSVIRRDIDAVTTPSLCFYAKCRARPFAAAAVTEVVSHRTCCPSIISLSSAACRTHTTRTTCHFTTTSK